MSSVGGELVEIVDKTGAVQRVVTRAEMRRDNLMHRNVAVFLQRTDGRLVVHQRADWKDVYPSYWDVAFGGVPSVGESDEEAAIRELAEEAGVTLSPEVLIDLGVRTQANAEVCWCGRFFAARTDAEVCPADGEVQQLDAIPLVQVSAWAVTTLVCPDIVPLLGEFQALLAD